MHHNDLPNECAGFDSEQEEEEVLDVLDLPQLYQKPSAKTLLETLSLLSLEPRSWDATPASPRPKPKVRSEGLPQYLTRIISSPLAWIHDDDDKDVVWDAASARLSERSGRTGMGAITRSFRIPIAAAPVDPTTTTMRTVIAPSQDQDTAIDISIHEPALTEDNLGLKTWASSFVLARKWHTLRQHLPLSPAHGQDRIDILELGAGTGLVGIAAAAVFQASVLLTDLPDIVPNLDRNIDTNHDTICSRRGYARAAILDWTQPEKIIYPQDQHSDSDKPVKAFVAESHPSKYPLVVAADPIYTPDHPALLVQTIACHLARTKEARVVIEFPIREAFAAERADLRSRMETLGLEICNEDTETGYDDWSEGRGEELAEVECWMGMWKWTDAVFDQVDS